MVLAEGLRACSGSGTGQRPLAAGALPLAQEVDDSERPIHEKKGDDGVNEEMKMLNVLKLGVEMKGLGSRGSGSGVRGRVELS